MTYTFLEWVQLAAPVVVIGAILLSLPPYERRRKKNRNRGQNYGR